MTLLKSALTPPSREVLARSILSGLLIVFFLASPTHRTTAQFASVSTLETSIPYGATDGDAVWSDIDNDGDQDLLVSGRGQFQSMTTLLLANSDGSLTPAGGAGLPAVESSSLALADFDRDGDLDVLITGQRGVTLSGELGLARVYSNNGAGIFSLAQDLYPAGVYRGSAEWGDYDLDGDPDIVLTGYQNGGSGFGALYRNDSGVFTIDQTVEVPAVGDSSVAWADYDGDSDYDFVVLGKSGETSSVRVARLFTNQGASGFATTDLTTNGLWNGAVIWLDAEGDGDLDLILTGNNGPDIFNRDLVTLLLIYDNAEGFVEAASGLPDAWQTSLSSGDFDNDGAADLLFNGLTLTANITRIYRNTGGTFSDSGIILRSGTGASAAFGDLDGDGSLDAAVTGIDTGGSTRSTYLYTSLAGQPNTPPAAPAPPISACWNGDDTVIFDWPASTDDQAPPEVLSYNLRVGSAPGLSDIISPPSSLDGHHRLSQLGRVSGSTRALLKGLSPGQYEWAVQAVDPAFTASPFSEEQNFQAGIRIARNDQAWVEGAGSIMIPVLDNDHPGYTDLMIQSVQNPAHGEITILENRVYYTPFSGWAGIEQFEYYALSPSTGHCSRATINVATTGFSLNPTWLKENRPAGTIVGAFTALPTREKSGEDFTYRLVAGAGSEDNASFRIDRNKLISARVFSADVKNSYTIRARATGSLGTIFESQFTITVMDVANNPPVDVLLSNSVIQENSEANITVGTFSCIDPDENLCRYKLYNEPDEVDNLLFAIVGSTLRTQAVFDYENRDSYTIRVKATDRTGLHQVKLITLTIQNMSDSAPGSVQLSPASVKENLPLFSEVGSFTTQDSDPGDTFRYRLVAGQGSDNNASFWISGDKLLTSQVFSLSDGDTYTIRVRSTDQTDRYFEQVFEIKILENPVENVFEFRFYLPILVGNDSIGE